MAVHGALVTYRRPDDLRRSLAALAEQTVQVEHLVIVDNDPASAAPALGTAGRVTYLRSPENLGPAGGLHRAVEHLLQEAADTDWIVFLDDDDPIPAADLLERVLRTAEAAGARVGAVGLAGARLHRGTLRRPLDAELGGLVPVDYIGGGQLPLYSVAALRDVGPPDPDLFFGFDDLELGLRLRRAGWGLYVDGALWLEQRAAAGRLGKAASLASISASAPTWRTYYSVRNLVVVLRQHGATMDALRRSGVVLAKPLVNLPRSPTVSLALLRVTIRALADGWRGRLGRTIEPG